MTKPKRESVITPRARLSFPALDKPRVMEQGKTPTYQLTLLFDKEAQATPEFKQLRRIVAQAVKDKWGDNPPKKLKLPFLSVDDLNNVPDGYEADHVIVRMNSTIQPGLVDGRNQELIGAQITEELYAGCYVRVATHAYSWNHPTGGPGVSLSLNHVQKLADGEPFVARTKPTDVFDAVLDEDDDEDDLEGFLVTHPPQGVAGNGHPTYSAGDYTMPKITLLLAITAGVLAVLLSPFAGGASLGLFITMITLARLARARKDLELARLDLQVARDQHRHEMKIWQARYRNQAMDLADLRKKIWRENNGRTPLRRVSDRKPEEDGA